jgi:DNA topoisomerase 2-associated protein PAT1
MSHSKGKKAIPRVFRHLTPDQRTNVLTVASAHLDTIDVVHGALVSPLPAAIKEEIELFINTVIPVLFSHLNEQPLFIIAGLLGIILSRCDVKAVVRTKVGLSLLTMLISRAEVLRESQQHAANSDEWQQYTSVYNAFFNLLEPMLPHIFPDTNPIASDDVYVWQFLAAMGVAANAEQQQRLVLGVKDRVMSSVGAARTLPTGEQEKRLGEVNLFMRALGLDVELLA